MCIAIVPLNVTVTSSQRGGDGWRDADESLSSAGLHMSLLSTQTPMYYLNTRTILWLDHLAS